MSIHLRRVTLAARRFQIAASAGWLLVVLRCGLGWQFFQEGVSKIDNPRPFSAVFLGNARGPWAGLFQDRIWDAHGLARLDQEQTQILWKAHLKAAQEHFRFNDRDRTKAARIHASYLSGLNGFFSDNRLELEEYRLQVERLQRDKQQAARREVYSLNGQVLKQQSELAGKRRPWLATLDGFWAGYERDISNLGAAATNSAASTFALTRPGRRWLDSRSIDRIIPWFDLVIGGLLILGLLTRITSLAAAGFLFSVVLSQWPPTTGPMSTYYHLNLTLALLVLAATGAGRIAGLDFFLNGCCSVKRKVTHEQLDT